MIKKTNADSMNSEQDGYIGREIGRILRAERQRRQRSLESICNIVKRKYRVKIARSTLFHFERSGPSPKTVRLLALLCHFGISLDTIFNASNEAIMVSARSTIEDLLEDKEFLEMCEYVCRRKPEQRKNLARAMIRLLKSLHP